MEKQIKKIIYGLDEFNDLGVFAISVVNMPAIERNFVALKSHEVKLKLDEKRKILYGPLLIPDKEILRIDPKTKEEYLIAFPKETIEKVAHYFLKQGNQKNHTYEHQFEIDGMCVVESWISESDVDKSVHLGINDAVGTWYAGVSVDNPDVWAKVESGEVKGFSIEGLFSELSKHNLNESAFLAELNEILNNK